MKILLAALCVLLLAFGIYFAFDEPGAETGDGPDGENLRPSAIENSAEKASSEELAQPDRTTAGGDVAARAVIGRCVSAEGGAAIGGCAVQLFIGAEAASRRWQAWSEEEIRARATTGADGAFSIPLTSVSAGALAVQIRAPGYATRAGAWSLRSPEPVLDLGDIVMHAGIKVSGSVREPDGKGVEGAAFMLVTTEREAGTRLACKTMFRAVTNAAGEFELEGLVSQGERYVGVENTGPLIAPRMVRLRSGTPELLIDVQVQAPDTAKTIRGSTVDERGQPLVGIRLNARGEGLMGRTVSGDDGQFELPPSVPHHDDGTSGVSLHVSDPSGKREPAAPKQAKVKWGQQDLRIVMRELATLQLTVVDEAGQPVSDYDAQVMHRDLESGQLTPGSGAKVRDSDDGRCQLPRLRRGEHHLLVTPKGERLGPSAVRRFTEIEGEMLVQVLVRRPVEVLVVTGGGDAVRGSEVKVSQPLFDLSSRPAETGRLRPAAGNRVGGGRAFVTLDEAVTDADGVARLTVAPGSWQLSVNGELHVPLRAGIDVTRDMPLFRVVVTEGATLAGTAGPAEIIAKLESPKILVESREPKKAAWGKLVGGAFEISSLPVGSYSVSVEFTLRCNPAHKGTVTVPLTEMQLRAGERRQLALDLRPAVPGTVKGQLRVDGQPLVDGHLFLVRRSAGGKVSVRARTDADGFFHSRLPSGEFSVRLALPAQPGPGWNLLPLPEPFVMLPGEESSPRYEVRIRKVRVRLLHAESKPLVRRRVRLLAPGYFRPGQLTTDEDGWVRIDPAPLSEFRIQAPAVSGRPAREFQAPAAGSEFELRAQKPR